MSSIALATTVLALALSQTLMPLVPTAAPMNDASPPAAYPTDASDAYNAAFSSTTDSHAANGSATPLEAVRRFLADKSHMWVIAVVAGVVGLLFFLYRAWFRKSFKKPALRAILSGMYHRRHNNRRSRRGHRAAAASGPPPVAASGRYYRRAAVLSEPTHQSAAGAPAGTAAGLSAVQASWRNGGYGPPREEAPGPAMSRGVRKWGRFGSDAH